EDADGIGEGHGVFRLAEAAGGGVEREGADGVGFLVGAEQPSAAGGDGEVAGNFAAAGGDVDEVERAGGAVAAVDGDGVVAAVRGVDEAAVRMDVDLGGGAVAGPVFGKGAEGLEGFE